jgi:25S rRNA (adenine2142-N1)-methyltransferase
MVNKTTKARKRPLSSTAKAITRAQPSVSSKVTQGTISTYHTLIKRRAQLERRLGSAQAADFDAIQRALDSVNQDLLRLGGIDAYQKASQLGQSSARGGDSSKVLIEWLHEAGYGRGSEASTRKGKGKGKATDMGQSCGRLR